VPSRLDPLDIDDVTDEEVRRRLAAGEDWYGDSAFFGAMAHAPDLFVRIYDALAAFPGSDRVTGDLLELMRLRIATVHQCAYCATVRTLEVRDAVADREACVTGDEIDPGPLTHHEELAVRLAERMATDPHRITDEFVDALRAGFGDEATTELLLFTALEVGLDRFCIALELDTTANSRYPDRLNYPHDAGE
jgi:alkylhydroperoxidase family enzyme